MPLVQLKNISISYGAQPLLLDAELIIDKGDRIGLIGRNGAGKSTLLKLLNDEISPDDGVIKRQQNLKVGRLIQEVPNNITLDVQSVIANGNAMTGELLQQYYQGDSADALIAALNETDAWATDQRVKVLCSKFNLDPAVAFNSLSGGMKRRVLMAQSLVNEPDILLLDEPTNHLDIDTILWLENLLINLNITLVMISHDRQFIDRLCNRIVEIDRGQLLDWPGNYQKYLELKEKALAEEERHNALFDKKLAQEEAWIRQGIKARRTRNEGRVRALKEMRETRRERREQQGSASFTTNTGNKSGKIVIEATDLSYQIEQRKLIDDFSITVMRGDKIGIIGANGTGKSTLIKILTGALTADKGNIKLGTNLAIAYLDQHRSDIKDELSVQDNVSGGSNEITIDGKSKHIMSYLQDFLFSPERARAPAAKLSGGERNRLMLAKLFTQPFNFLILDEPTNDLDYETLELLEQLLIDYQGTLLLVSHDRAFLNNVVTSTIAFDGDGIVREYVGGYDDWLRQSADNTTQKNAQEKPQTTTSSDKKQKTSTAQKLSYRLQRELDQLPQKIDQLEQKISTLQETMNDPEFYNQDQQIIAEAGNQLKTLEQALEDCFGRWEALESGDAD